MFTGCYILQEAKYAYLSYLYNIKPLYCVIKALMLEFVWALFRIKTDHMFVTHPEALVIVIHTLLLLRDLKKSGKPIFKKKPWRIFWPVFQKSRFQLNIAL